MKYAVLGLACLVGCAAGSTQSPEPKQLDVDRVAFENPGGMWVPGQLNSAEHAAQLKRLGLALDPAKLADPLSYPLGAIVHLGNCTASFVSPDGLIITNHHCVQGALQYSSSPEENLVRDGFLAKSRADEKWNGPGSRVYVTQKLTDVTGRMRAGIDAIDDDEERFRTVEARQKALVAECEQGRPELRCELAAYDGGSTYQLIERRQLNDVRLVHAPPMSVGNYGGEIDNWMWPRHTGDYSFYRAYVGPDGSAAEYSPNNVPYRPEHYLTLPTEPLTAGDLVFVAGYPGRTYRNYTAAETRQVIDWYYPWRIQLMEELLAAMARASKDDLEAHIRATSHRRGAQNVLKYTRGALEGLTKGGAAATRETHEATLRAKDPELFATLDAEFARRVETRELDAVVGEFRYARLLTALVAIVRMAEERPKLDDERKPGYQERDSSRLEQAQRRLDRLYNRNNDQELLTTVFSRAAERKLELKTLSALLGDSARSTESIREAVTAAYGKTELTDTEYRLKLLREATSEQLAAMDDPLMRLAVALRSDRAAAEKRSEASKGRTMLLRPRYLALLRTAAGREIASDANSTLRVTYGTVRGYRTTNEAPLYTPFTTLAETVAKATDAEPFDAPKSLLSEAKTAGGTRFVDERVGDVPVNYLSDLDITGGNSGSPTINRKGEIVGLAFDGNYESMASDWLFMPDITRCIAVDIRYVLWLMDEVFDAGHLVREMGGKPADEPVATR